MEDVEFQKLQKAKILVPRQSVLFKLDPVNALTVTEVRKLLLQVRALLSLSSVEHETGFY